MVKLAKKRIKGFKKSYVDSKKLKLIKTGIINVTNTYQTQGKYLGLEAYKLVIALYALSDKNCATILHEEEMRMAASLLDFMIDEAGNVDIDQFKQAFTFYDGLLHTIFKANKLERKKAKKFKKALR